MINRNAWLIPILIVLILSGFACQETKDDNPLDSGNSGMTYSPSPTTTTEAQTTPLNSPAITPEVPPATTLSPEDTQIPAITEPPKRPAWHNKTRCELDMEMIQNAIDVYNSQYDQWPTINGQPGPIEWDKIVPEYMEVMPYADNRCQWKVDDDPEGFVCKEEDC